MPKLRNGSKGHSNSGSLDRDSGILPLSSRSPHHLFMCHNMWPMLFNLGKYNYHHLSIDIETHVCMDYNTGSGIFLNKTGK